MMIALLSRNATSTPCMAGPGFSGTGILNRNTLPLIALALATMLSGSAAAGAYSPYINSGQPQRLLWGDTHVHTSYSTDAALLGNTLGPGQAYRFARGETVVSSSGLKARLIKPLDFLVVADHSENLGLASMMAESNPELLASKFGRELQKLFGSGELLQAMAFYDEHLVNGEDPLPLSTSLKSSMWRRMVQAADDNNSPGSFSAMIGYEWTGTPGGSNLHRNVIYRDSGEQAGEVLPFTAFESENPERLWDWMEAYEKTTGGRVLAIPHNGNLSNGLMFDDVRLNTKDPLDAAYARRRMRWEPVYEVTQMKGDGEAHPLLSPGDEFADFETWDTGSFARAKKPGMVVREYAREAWKRGLLYEGVTGGNPFKFGLIGSTDSHTSLATSREENFFGKAPPFEPSVGPTRFKENITGHYPDPDGIDYAISHTRASASGLTAVWASENSRAGVWDALQSKEVYATTGTRISVRLFAGWNLRPDDLNRSDLVAYGYANGVPMGGELTGGEPGGTPAFLIHALRDPDGANLDRVQVIKGWVDEAGKAHERIYDIAVSGGRAIDDDGRCFASVGNTVEASSATYRNDIGAPTLAAHWADPEFDTGQRAFYYVRVLEIPTPRWTSYDARYYGLEIPPDVPGSIQERAYTSAVWYSPEG